VADERQDRPSGPEPDRRPEGDGPRGDGPRGDRPHGDRPDGDRPDGDRPDGDRPARDRPYGDRPPGKRSYQGKPSGPARDRPYGDRPPGKRPYGGKPGGGRAYGGNKPYGSKPHGGKPGGRPQGSRPYGDRPRDDRPREDRPQHDRRVDYSHRDRPQGPRPQGPRPQGPRPQRGPWDRDRGPRRPYGDRGRPDRYAPPRPPMGPAPAEVLSGDEEIVAGRRPVEEAFAARREARRLLVVPERRAALDQLVLHATTLRIPVVEVEGGTITAVTGFDGHQGVALVVAPRRWATLDEVLALAKSRGEAPFLLALDHLEDPQNVGTLLRSAEACGVHGVIFPTRGAAPISPAAIKTSAGAVEHLLLVPLPDLAGGLVDLHARGVRVIGADGDASMTVREADLRGPVVIVTGSEGRGLNAKVRKRVDLMARIPMRGKVASLNASVAGSVFLFEAAAQRDLPEAERARDDGAGEPGLITATEVPPVESPAVSEDATEAQAESRPVDAPEGSEAATEVAPPGVAAAPAGEPEATPPGTSEADDLLPETPPPVAPEESA